MLLDKKRVSTFTKTFGVLLAAIFILSMVATPIASYFGAGTSTQTFDGLVQEGNNLQDSGQFKLAADKYEQALAINPNDANVRVDLAICYYAQQTRQSLNQAITNIRRVIELNPKHSKAHYNYGIFLNTAGDKAGAQAEFETYLKLDPSGDSVTQAKSYLRKLGSK